MLHVAIAMDGNGRWAEMRGLSRTAGHLVGASAVCRVVSSATALGVGRLTLFAFSSDNWKRPSDETAGIFAVVEAYLRAQAPLASRRGVRVRVLGRRERLPASLVEAIETAERATSAGRLLELQIAIDYSGRGAILAAAERLAAAQRFATAEPFAPAERFAPAEQFDERHVTREEFAQELHSGGDVDLLIRTGGERRLSDFLLWECAYAELVFTRTLWPDFDGPALAAAIAEFRRRDRRFGSVHTARA